MKLLKESGYKGETTTILQPSDIPISNACTLVSTRRCATSASTSTSSRWTGRSITSRRAKKEPTNKAAGTCSHHLGRRRLLNPLSNASLMADPNKAWPGWPTDAKIEELRMAFASASEAERRRRLAADVQHAP